MAEREDMWQRSQGRELNLRQLCRVPRPAYVGRTQPLCHHSTSKNVQVHDYFEVSKMFKGKKQLNLPKLYLTLKPLVLQSSAESPSVV